jgi:hypothetical protein
VDKVLNRRVVGEGRISYEQFVRMCASVAVKVHGAMSLKEKLGFKALERIGRRGRVREHEAKAIREAANRAKKG